MFFFSVSLVTQIDSEKKEFFCEVEKDRKGSRDGSSEIQIDSIWISIRQQSIICWNKLFSAKENPVNM